MKNQINRALLVMVTALSRRFIKKISLNRIVTTVGILCVCLLTGCATQNSPQINNQNTLLSENSQKTALFTRILGNASDNTPFIQESTPFGDFATITVSPLYISALGTLCRQVKMDFGKQIKIVAVCKNDKKNSELLEWQLLLPISEVINKWGNNEY